MRYRVVAVLFAFGCGCATGGSDDGNDDPDPIDAMVVGPRIDARTQPTPDAAPIDAAPVTNDAGELFCGMSNANCGEAGTCCFIQFCVPGQGVGDSFCVPD